MSKSKSKVKGQKSEVWRELAWLSPCEIASDRRGWRGSADGSPEDVVQLIVVDEIVLAEIHARGTRGGGGLFGIALVQWDARLFRRVGRHHRRRLERRVHGPGAGVVVGHWIQAQDQLHGAKH